jgi:hypothetical protein
VPRYTIRIPKYRLHKASGQAVVTLNGRDVYLGKHGTPESKARYNQLIGEWQLCGRTTPPTVQGVDRTVDELILAYVDHVQRYYVKNGQPTSTQQHVRDALMPLHQLYGTTTSNDFGPLAFKALRQSLIDRGWSRPTTLPTDSSTQTSDCAGLTLIDMRSTRAIPRSPFIGLAPDHRYRWPPHPRRRSGSLGA